MYIEGDSNTIIVSHQPSGEPAWMAWVMLTATVLGVMVQML